MTMQFLRILWTYVQMVHHQVWLVCIFECLSVLDAEVAFVDISNISEPSDNLIKH